MDPEDTNSYGEAQKAEDAEMVTNDKWQLQSNFTDKPPPSEMDFDNVMGVANDTGLVSPAGDNDSDNHSSPEPASNPTSL